VADVEKARTFFGSVLGWRYDPAGRQVEGLAMHHGVWAYERSTLFLCIGVADLDAAVGRVRQAGGTAEEPHEEPYGRVSGCVDDQGMPFALFGLEPSAGSRVPSNGTVHGDLSYITVETVDSGRFRAFFAAVAGWRFTPGRVDDGWAVDGVAPMTGIHGGHPQPTVVPMYRVDDIAAAIERVRSAGGTSTEPEQQPYGVTAECTDNQGTHFYLGTL
jgi:predicted enzyme related to lactoylglutathione lyase